MLATEREPWLVMFVPINPSKKKIEARLGLRLHHLLELLNLLVQLVKFSQAF